MKLAISASAAWRVTVEQQVQTPLREPPLPAMTAGGARVVARGAFFPIERRGRGTATLHELPTGRLALRLEGFETAANTDLFVWLSRARRPRTTRAALAAPYRELAPLKATTGDQNYLLPRSLRAEAVRSIVIWCEPVQIAYTAASLRR